MWFISHWFLLYSGTISFPRLWKCTPSAPYSTGKSFLQPTLEKSILKWILKAMPRPFPHQWLVLYLPGLNQYTAFLYFFLFALYGFLLRCSSSSLNAYFPDLWGAKYKNIFGGGRKDVHADDWEYTVFGFHPHPRQDYSSGCLTPESLRFSAYLPTGSQAIHSSSLTVT